MMRNGSRFAAILVLTAACLCAWSAEDTNPAPSPVSTNTDTLNTPGVHIRGDALSVEVFNTEGQTVGAYPTGLFRLNQMTPSGLTRMKAYGEELRGQAETRETQQTQKEEAAKKADEAAAKEDAKARQNQEQAERKRDVESRAMRLRDPKTGKRVEAVPVSRLPGAGKDTPGEATAGAQPDPAGTEVLYDRRTGRRVKAVPVQTLIEEETR